MPIIGFGFNKIFAEKKDNPKNIEIKNNIQVTSMEESKIKIDKHETSSLKIQFDFSVDYSTYGKVELLGNITYLDNPQKIKEILNKWKKEEKLPTDFGAMIYNFIIAKSSTKSLQLEEDLGLPLHITLPKILQKKKE